MNMNMNDMKAILEEAQKGVLFLKDNIKTKKDQSLYSHIVDASYLISEARDYLLDDNAKQAMQLLFEAACDIHYLNEHAKGTLKKLERQGESTMTCYLFIAISASLLNNLKDKFKII